MKKGSEDMNTKMLNSKMALFGDNQTDLANELGLSLTRTNAKINAKDGAEFTQNEIAVMIGRYHLTPEEVQEIFFRTTVHCKETGAV
jgi:hypothetical protein